ncbi:hypothetical protein G5I_10327 [Acromyrmex echinatior]|uniref:Uncharacterized protein n=1 Tax=Acromyrmex echinatior TaxID=103372 RepID=F4WWL2_ACREC|nr:hypothetical protein G5I_10327 [Acromyrmex echinatior]
MGLNNRIHASARLTIVEGTAHQAHGARVARSGNGLAGAPHRSNLEARDEWRKKVGLKSRNNNEIDIESTIIGYHFWLGSYSITGISITQSVGPMAKISSNTACNNVQHLKVSASRMKNDFVHVAPSTGLTVCHSVTPIINDILDYLGANFTQNSRNIVFQSWNCFTLWATASIFSGVRTVRALGPLLSSTNIPFSRTFLTNLRIAPSVGALSRPILQFRRHSTDFENKFLKFQNALQEKTCCFVPRTIKNEQVNKSVHWFAGNEDDISVLFIHKPVDYASLVTKRML